MKHGISVLLAIAILSLCACALAEAGGAWAPCVSDYSIVIVDSQADMTGLIRLTGAITLGAGESTAIDAPASENPTFASSDARIAKVDEDGGILAVKAGRAVIRTYLSNDEHVDVYVEVKSAPKSIKLPAKKGTMKLGETFKLSCTLSRGSSSVLSWDSTDDGIVSVDEHGKLTAKSVGECVISVETYNGLSAECAVTVVMPEPAKVRLSAYKGKLYEGETYELTATLEGGYQETVTWSTDDESILAVDENGVLTARRAGTAIVRAQATRGNYSNCVVQVLPGSTDIRLNERELTLYEGGSGSLTARVTGGGGSYSLVSMDHRIAVIDEETREIRAINEGEAIVRAVTPNGVYDECLLRVLAAPEPFALTAAANAVAVSETLETRFLDSNALPVSYESDNPGVALVNADGLVLGVSPGAAVIRARAGGRGAELILQVQPLATGIKLSAESGVLGVGDSYTLSYALTGGAGTVTFKSSDPSILTVDSASGEITAVAEGEAKVAATLKNNVFAMCSVVVTRAPARLALDQKEIVLGARDSTQLTYSIDDGAHGTIAWRVSDAGILTVNKDGVVSSTGAKGAATVTAYTHNMLTDTARVIVIAPPDAITVDAAPLEPGGKFDAYILMRADETRELSAACEGYTHVTFSYESTQPGVAAIDANGLLAARSQGTTLITARAYTGMEVKVLLEVQ